MYQDGQANVRLQVVLDFRVVGNDDFLNLAFEPFRQRGGAGTGENGAEKCALRGGGVEQFQRRLL